MSKQLIEVDTKTFIRFWLVILAFGLVALFVWKARVGLMIVGIAIFLAIAIQPLADRIKKLLKKENSTAASVLAYTSIILVVCLIVSFAAPVIIDETLRFVGQLPETFEGTLGGWAGVNEIGNEIGINNLQGQILSAIESFSVHFLQNFSNLVFAGIGTISQLLTNVILILVLTLLFAIEGPEILRGFWDLLSGRRKDAPVRAYQRLTTRIGEVIATYVSKQVTVAILDGLVAGTAVLLLSLIFGFSSGLAAPMGLIAMVLYLIPMFGPIISCGLITLLLTFSSPVAGLIFLVFYIIYAQIENNLIAPKLQGNALNLPSALILTAIVIGMYMFGLLGAIIAIPIAGCIKVVIEEWPKLREANK